MRGTLPRTFFVKTPILVLLAALTVPAIANLASDELLAAFQTRLEKEQPIDELIDSLEDCDDETLADLTTDLDKAWPPVRDRYLQALESGAGTKAGADRNAKKRRIDELRKEFMEVKALGEGSMKPLLKSKSQPALDELRLLVAPTAEQLVGDLPAATSALRTTALRLAEFRDAALDAALSTTPSESRKQLADAEARIATEASDLPRDGLRVLEKNRKIAEDDEVPEAEARGIEEANLWRLLVGLNALELDPKLCDAARDHSKDMAEQGFFAHDSPVPGKRTPWDRAKNFGTTASGENIYAGSANPSGANKGWFFSPGHHKNMFGGGHRRIGLGNHDRHWTQLFGR